MNIIELKVLIIEDDEIYSHKLKSWIEPFVHSVTTANTAERGSHFVTSGNPDVIFLDNILPGLKGREAMEVYQEFSPDSTIVLMSATYTVDELAKGVTQGAHHIINKNDSEKKDIIEILNKIAIDKSKKGPKGGILNFFKKKKKASFDKIAVVEDDNVFRLKLNQALNEVSQSPFISNYASFDKFVMDCKSIKPDLIFLDYNVGSEKADKTLQFINDELPDSKVVMISSQNSVNVVFDLYKIGFTDYIIKDSLWKENLKNIVDKLCAFAGNADGGLNYGVTDRDF